MHKYKVDALNLNDNIVSQRIDARNATQAAAIVTRKNKYLRVYSVCLIDEPVREWPEVSELDILREGK